MRHINGMLISVLRNAATAGLVSLEYKSAFQGMAHLVLSLQYVRTSVAYNSVFYHLHKPMYCIH